MTPLDDSSEIAVPQPLAQWLTEVIERLHSVSETPLLDAQLAVGSVVKQNRSWVLAHPESILDEKQIELLERIVTRLEKGEPLPYVLGHWEFFGLDFVVDPSVLIPRPETELLVDQGLEWLRKLPNQGDIQPTAPWAMDIGTGSGCIAVSLATNMPGLHVIASDVSMSALKVAQYNSQQHDVADRVHFVQSDLLSAMTGTSDCVGAHCNVPLRGIDLVCANLPYIPQKTLAGLRVKEWEPTLALDGGADGLQFIRRLVEQLTSFLISTSLLLLEIEASQGCAVYEMARRAFPAAEVTLLQDLAGIDRCVRIKL
jgi:release factor glutamine methyltransferase